MATAAPHVAPIRWLVGTELIRARKEARLSVAKAAALTGINSPKIGHMENGRQQQTEEDITTLLSAYGADARSIGRLIELSARVEEANWWKPWSDVVDTWFSSFVGLERVADREFAYERDAVPGLLQTPEYATALTERSMLVRADRVQRVVDFRMARAERLTEAGRPLRLHTVITSWALEVAIGTREVRRAQLEHLIRMADLPNVTIQILRPEDGIPAVHIGKFTLLSFNATSQLCYIQLLDDALYYYDEQRLRTYQHGVSDLERVAASPERSVELIRKML
ncbi:helix-turn-helix domain-containing protein [Pseudonocardia spinosispora]|uniref:helix-turn-helix domain-containing protein n=1 Tax=Pseudonocardia spinosispora TaxID=103441 RepID=UPI0004072F78|nr:helix-turn-helix transcriptional regulator [Pseudonocardia spinosispora]